MNIGNKLSNLKVQLLDLAIRGKLVEQRPEEGTAEELYAQIQDEKKKLIAEGKIKKEKPLPEITEEEIPFDIPESWKWVRIGQIYSLQAGTNIKAELIQEAPTEKNIYKCYGGNGVRGYVSVFNHNGNYPIIGRQGALCGNIKQASGYFYATEHAVCVKIFSNSSVDLACFFLKELNLNQYSTSTAQPGLSVEKINRVLIPLPPLAEQKRIVAKIKEILHFCDKLK
ncbi:MAG: restriction endonuclease subunit S [Succinivibrio sp.]